MGLFTRLIAKVTLNGLALWIAKSFFSGFILTGGVPAFVIGVLVFFILNISLRPILRMVATPLVWITFGLFNIVINMIILWTADLLLAPLVISDLQTLFWVSLIVAIANSIA